MFPKHQQDQYELTGATVPQSVRKLLKALEHIKKAFLTDKEREGPKAHVTGGGSSKKRIISFSDQIPKKPHKEAKCCALCKKHGAAQKTHNTGDCRKYEKGGTLKKAFAGKSTQRNLHKSNAPRKHNTSYEQLSAKIAKLEKSNMKLKCMNKKCKHNHDSDSNNSDSS